MPRGTDTTANLTREMQAPSTRTKLDWGMKKLLKLKTQMMDQVQQYEPEDDMAGQMDNFFKGPQVQRVSEQSGRVGLFRFYLLEMETDFGISERSRNNATTMSLRKQVVTPDQKFQVTIRVKYSFLFPLNLPRVVENSEEEKQRTGQDFYLSQETRQNLYVSKNKERLMELINGSFAKIWRFNPNNYDDEQESRSKQLQKQVQEITRNQKIDQMCYSLEGVI